MDIGINQQPGILAWRCIRNSVWETIHSTIDIYLIEKINYYIKSSYQVPGLKLICRRKIENLLEDL
jgi:hypothetical protein